MINQRSDSLTDKFRKSAFAMITILLFFVMELIITPNFFSKNVLATIWHAAYDSNGKNITCFPAGTKITMGNGTYKNIEDIMIQDKVMSQDENGIKSISTVTSIENPIRDNMCDIKFTDGENLNLTKEHPLFTPLGWKAISPGDTAKENPTLVVGQLTPGDKVAKEDNSWGTVSFFSCQPETVQTYNLLLANGAHTYFANRFLAHNKHWDLGNGDSGYAWTCFPAGTKVLMSGGEHKNIEDVKVGDQVISQSEAGVKSVSTVSSLDQPVRDHMCQINFEDGDKLELTSEHPLLSRNGWKAIIPKKEAYADPNLVVTPLTKADALIKSDGSTGVVKSFSCWSETVQAYNLILGGGAHTYFADDYLAHNKGDGRCDPGIWQDACKGCGGNACNSCGNGIDQQGAVKSTTVTSISPTEAKISWKSYNSHLNCSDANYDYGSWDVFISTSKTLVENNCDNCGVTGYQLPSEYNGLTACGDFSANARGIPGDCIIRAIGEKGTWFNTQTGLDSTYDGLCGGAACGTSDTPDGKHKSVALLPNTVYYIKVASKLFYPNGCQYGGAWCGAGPTIPLVGQCSVSLLPPSSTINGVGDVATFKTTFSGANEPVAPGPFDPYMRSITLITHQAGGINDKTVIDANIIHGWFFGSGGWVLVHIPGLRTLVEPVGGTMYNGTIRIPAADLDAISPVLQDLTTIDSRVNSSTFHVDFIPTSGADAVTPHFSPFDITVSQHDVGTEKKPKIIYDSFTINGYFFGQGGSDRVYIGGPVSNHWLTEPVKGTANVGTITIPAGHVESIGVNLDPAHYQGLREWCITYGCRVEYGPDSNTYQSSPYTSDSTNLDNVGFSQSSPIAPPNYISIEDSPQNPNPDPTSPYKAVVTAIKATQPSTNLQADAYATGVASPPACTATTPITISAVATPAPPGNNTAWWQVKNSDVQTNGNIISPVPANNFFDIPPTSDSWAFPGIPAAGGSLNFNPGAVSAATWGWSAVGSPWKNSGSKVFNYQWFSDQMPSNYNPPLLGPTPLASDLTTGGDLENGYYWYKYDGTESSHNGADLDLPTINFQDRKVILLVTNANLNIKGNISLNKGHGFFMAIVGKDVNGGHGNITAYSGVTSIEGLYVADSTFNDTENGTVGTNQLYARGSVVAYDGINMLRNVGPAQNDTTPSDLFEYAPDQIMLFPQVLGTRKINWKEVAP